MQIYLSQRENTLRVDNLAPRFPSRLEWTLSRLVLVLYMSVIAFVAAAIVVAILAVVIQVVRTQALLPLLSLIGGAQKV